MKPSNETLHLNSMNWDIRKRQIDFAKAISNRKKIYLDTRFWIILREERTKPARILHGLLYDGVQDGALVCPVSASTFVEVVKQSNTSSMLKRTAKLIDDLSMGAAFIDLQTRIGTEFAHFVHSTDKSLSVHGVNELVWTKLVFTLGSFHPHFDGLTNQENLAIQRAFLDRQWDTSMSEIVDRIGDQDREVTPSFERTAYRLTSESASYAGELKSYKQAYKSEVAGAVDLFRDTFAEIVCEMSESVGITPPERGSSSWNETQKLFGNMVANTLTLRPETRRVFRTLQILAMLHAAVRWDKARKFHANDFLDFEHAACALAYCDAFFTEKSLCELSTKGNTKLREVNDCLVTASVEDAVKIANNFRS